MIRIMIAEPNFTSTFFKARRPEGGSVGEPASLTIVLRVYLAPMDPSKPYTSTTSVQPATVTPNLTFNTYLADGPQQMRRGAVLDYNQNPFAARSWTRQEWDQYKASFKQVVESSWNNQILLLPPEDPQDGLNDEDYLSLIANPRMPAHVVCSLIIQLTDDPNSANAIIQVARLDREVDPLDRLNSPGHGHVPMFRSYAWMLTNEDVYRVRFNDRRWPNLRFTQVTAAHEVGHWLGRPTSTVSYDRFQFHVDSDNVPRSNPNYAKLQYGATGSHYGALMGGGSLVTEFEAAAWLNRARRHTRVLLGWQTVYSFQFTGIVQVSDRQKRLLAQPNTPAAPPGGNAPARPAQVPP